MTISAAERLSSSSSLMPVGMPRPLSSTEIELSVWMVTRISSQNPARASSTALSTTSNTMWCKPVPSEVSPMYMPGRLRTASRPFRTLMASEAYSLALGLAANSLDPHRHDDVLEPLLAAVADQGARGRVAEGALELGARNIVQHVEQIVHVESDIERIARVVDLELFLGFFLVGVRGNDLQAAVGKHPAHAAEFLVRQDRGSLQRLAQRFPVGQQLVFVLRWNDARVVGELAVDQLGDELDCTKTEGRLARRKLDANFLVGVGEELGQLEHGLSRHDRLLTREVGVEFDLGKGEAVAVGRHQLDLASLYDHQQTVEVIANVLLRHGVLHEPEHTTQGLLRHRKARHVACRLGEAREIFRRQRLQAKAALAGPYQQPLVLRLQADLGLLRQRPQDVEQLPRAHRKGTRILGAGDAAAGADLDLDIGRQERHGFPGAVDQNVRQDRQRMTPLDDAS